MPDPIALEGPWKGLSLRARNAMLNRLHPSLVPGFWRMDNDWKAYVPECGVEHVRSVVSALVESGEMQKSRNCGAVSMQLIRRWLKPSTMTYKEALSVAMQFLATDPKFRLLGYGILNGKGGNGTMKGIPNEKCVETTVAENLLLGMAQGFAMKGYRPLAYIERADFLACGLSAITNHLDKCREISRGEFNPCVIIRVTVGNRIKPLFTGATHTSDPSIGLAQMLRMPVYRCFSADEVTAAYERAAKEQRDGIGSSMIFDYKDLL